MQKFLPNVCTDSWGQFGCLGPMKAYAFSYTGNGYNDGVSAAREDVANGQNDNSCNDHFANNPNFNTQGNEGYCAGFKIGYAAEMAAAGVTR